MLSAASICVVGAVRMPSLALPRLQRLQSIALQEAKVKRAIDFLEEPKVMSEKDLAAKVCSAVDEFVVVS